MSDTQTGQAATSPAPTASPTPTPPPASTPPAAATSAAPTATVAPAPSSNKPQADAQAINQTNTLKTENRATGPKDDDFRKLILQLGDISSDLTDKALTARINQLVGTFNLPGRNDRSDYKTSVAYVVQDLEKDDIRLRMSGSLRVELGQLAATFPGLQNMRMQQLVESTPEIQDKAVIKAIRMTAAEVAGQPDQQATSVISKIDALANRARLATDPGDPSTFQSRQEAPVSRPMTPAAPVIGQPERVVAAGVEPAAAPVRPGRMMADIMSALRPVQPETPEPWDKQLTPMGDRITAYNARMQANGEEADLKRAERSGATALTAMKEFSDGPGSVLMSRIRDASKTDPEGMAGVLAEMREGGRYAGLRQDLNVALQHQKFAASYDSALSAVTTFGGDRAEVDKIAAQRADATAISGRFQKLDAEVGKAASELPSRSEGKSFVNELSERTQEAVMKAVEVVTNAINRLRSPSSPSPSPS